MLKSAPSVSSYPLESTWIEIKKDVFKRNLWQLKKDLKGTKICLPIKANAYGHGLLQIARWAKEEQVDYLAVSSLSEGIKLREAGLNTIPILVMGAFQSEQIQSLVDYELDLSISSFHKAQEVQRLMSSFSKKARVHLEIETGMNRTGSRFETSKRIYDYLQKEPCFEIVGIYSHLALSEDIDHPLTKKQIALFDRWIKSCPYPHLFHLANSSATVLCPSIHYSMVRPGLLCFGLCPKELSLKYASCFSLKSRVSFFKVIEKGESVGYGTSYIAQKQTRIATVPIGYGDGYRRALSNVGEVLIRSKRYPIVGHICMDQLMVDLNQGEAYVGDEVVLIGQQGEECITVQEIAKLCQTIPYEILTGFNERIPRYVT